MQLYKLGAIAIGVSMSLGLLTLWFINPAYVSSPPQYALIWILVWICLFIIAKQAINRNPEVSAQELLKTLFLATIIGTFIGKSFESLLYYFDPTLYELAAETSIKYVKEYGVISGKQLAEYEAGVRAESKWNLKNFIFSLLPIWIIGFVVSLIVSWLSQRIFKKLV